MDMLESECTLVPSWHDKRNIVITIHSEHWHLKCQLYRAFHRFGQGKVANGGLVLGSSGFSILSQLPYKMILDSKVVKIDSKITISIR